MDRMKLKDVRTTISNYGDVTDDLWEEYMRERQLRPANDPVIIKLIERINGLKSDIAKLKEDYPRWEVKKKDPTRLVYPAFK